MKTQTDETCCPACDTFKLCQNVADKGEREIWCCFDCDPRDAAEIVWERDRDQKWLDEDEPCRAIRKPTAKDLEAEWREDPTSPGLIPALLGRDDTPTDPCITCPPVATIRT